MEDDLSEIQKCFQNETIFLTGATGFVGTLVLEKLLRSCHTNKIYLLIRSKDGNDPQSRLQSILAQPQFDHIFKIGTKVNERIHLINGNLTEKNLGMSENDQDIIERDVSIVIHCAATQFMESYNTAIKVNVRATRDLLNHAEKMPNLKSFVYVSTAYSNCNQKKINEVFYESPFSPNELINSIELMNTIDPSEEKRICKKLIQDWPNPYTFTKQSAENLIRESNLPVSIVRPSIVTATFAEPIRGYVNSSVGLTAYIISFCIGVLQVIFGIDNTVIDVTPADFVVNTILASAWTTAKEHKDNRESEVPIYNCVSGPSNPLSFKLLNDVLYETRGNIVTKRTVWYPAPFITNCTYNYKILWFLVHVIPTYIADFVLKCKGEEPWIAKLYESKQESIDLLHYFSTNTFNFTNKNTVGLWNKMSIKDRELFNFDHSVIDWQEYFITYVKGIIVYFFNEEYDEEHYKQQQKRLDKLKLIDRIVKVLYILFGLYVLKVIVFLFT